MKFTRFQLVLLIAGLTAIASGILHWIRIRQNLDALVATPETIVREVSGGYAYTPIAKPEVIKDLETGTTRLISPMGQIKVNINSSDVQELCRLPGVGPSTAGRILEYRLQHGPFLRVEELDHVKGIGPKTIEKLKDQAYAGDPDPLDQSMLNRSVAEREEKKKEEKTITIESEPCGPGRININSASLEELISLPRIGAKTAERIIRDREANGPFKDVNDLTRVKGIGLKTLEKMKDRICAE